MTLTMMLLLAAAIVLPLVWIARRHSTGKTVKKPLIAHCFSFFALVAAATVFGFVYSGSAMAADTAAAAAASSAAAIESALAFSAPALPQEAKETQAATTASIITDLVKVFIVTRINWLNYSGAKV